MDFYYVDQEYMEFLQNFEKVKRGFTKVPNTQYAEHSKFVLGVVLKIEDFNYYVPVSSFDKKQEANILIRITGDIVEVKGSLRFNYMFPVPDEFLEKVVINDIEDDKYRALLYKEYRFCKESAEKIQKKANKIYIMVTTNRKPLLTDNSCDFKLLEQGYRIYKDKVRQE
ncbi:MAG: type III toxin-antitoxin system ToxN/AbiQ family toxin [Clostridia bacterium]|nr:type III toxin-antitoxin system ToxN/AbiQ family toxin [Clostridia bacterium]MDO5302838.1 type III toxin-antitoxin system ToxN/AbiQ family toxin [Clostridia bacterium]